jgi:hypothetical protein
MKFKIYGIMLLVCFTLLGVLLYVNKEGFYNDYSDYKTIDRIKNSSDKYAYCIAGNITCSDSSLNQIKDNYSGGKTYDYLCNDGNYAECTNFVKYMDEEELMNWKTPTARDISFPFSDKYKGFTIPYIGSYIPVDIIGNYVNFYDSSKNLVDNVNKCEFLSSQSETDSCNSALNPKTTPPSKPEKCIADYGTRVGDSLCCGQKGVLQHYASEYVCPSSKPTCSNFDCRGGTYGTCS